MRKAIYAVLVKLHRWSIDALPPRLAFVERALDRWAAVVNPDE